MKKITFVLIMLGIAWLHPAAAQISLSVTGGSGISSIPERFGNAHVSLLSSYAVTPLLDLGLSVGFQYFVPERFANQYTNVIPITLEARYRLQSESVRPYAQLELGIAQVDWKYREHLLFPVDFYEFMPDMNLSRRNKEWFPMISLGVGAFLPLSNQLSLDLGLRLGVVAGGATSDRTLIYGRVPETVSAIHRDADEWNYLRLVVGIRADL